MSDVKPLYLNGKWVTTGKPLGVTNPSTGESIGSVATVNREQMQTVLDDANNALPAWRSLTGKERGIYLRRIAEGVEKRADEIARVISLENGKPLPQSKGEVNGTIDHLQWFAEEARRTYGQIVPHQAPGKRHWVLKQPVGVVGAIAPWNFPLILGIRKVAPAMAAGCPVILKPASATPLSSVLFAEAVHEAEVPAGVFQLVAGRASEIAAAMFAHPACRKISFTGSTEVGKELMRNAAENVTRLSLELGGHAPLIVFDDADIDTAVEAAIIAKFRNSGQSCIAANRIYVHRPVLDSFIEKFVAKTKQVKVGDGFEEGVEVGPLINAEAVDFALSHIQQAVATGAKILCGGNRIGDEASCFLEPTLLLDVTPQSLCMTEETFAPVIPIVPFDTEAEVIEQANNTQYGLAAYFFSNNINRIWRVAEALEAGTIGVNDGVPATSQCPFGGMKQSGIGRELGTEGIDAYLETKHVSFANIE